MTAVIYNDPTKLSSNVLQPTVPVIPKKSFSRLYGKHDVFDGEYNLSQKLLAEFLGTTLFFYVFVSCNVFYDDPNCSILGSCLWVELSFTFLVVYLVLILILQMKISRNK